MPGARHLLRILVQLGVKWEARRRDYKGLIHLFDDFQIVVLFLLNTIYAVLITQALWVRLGMGALALAAAVVFAGRLLVTRIRTLPLQEKWDSLVWSHYGQVMSEAVARSAKRGAVHLSYFPFIGAEFEDLLFSGGFSRKRRYSGFAKPLPDFVICDAEYLRDLRHIRVDGTDYGVIDLPKILQSPTYLKDFAELKDTPLGGVVYCSESGALLAAPLRWGITGIALRGTPPPSAVVGESFRLSWLGTEEARQLKQEGKLRLIVWGAPVSVIQLINLTINPNSPAMVRHSDRAQVETTLKMIAELVDDGDCVKDPLRLIDIVSAAEDSDLMIVVGGGSWLIDESIPGNREVSVMPVSLDDGEAGYLVWCEVLAFIRELSSDDCGGDTRWRRDANCILDWLLGRSRLHKQAPTLGTISSFPACSFSKLRDFREVSLGGRIAFPQTVRMPVRELPPSVSIEALTAKEWDVLFSNCMVGRRGGTR